MYRLIFVAVLVAGVVLIVLGIQAADSLGSDISRFFNDSPTDKAIWLLIVGSVMGIVGLVGTIVRSRTAT